MKASLKPLLAGIVLAVAGSAAADRITFYQDDNYRGREFTAEGEVSNFYRNGFHDRISSAVVHDGQWEICVDTDFRGACSILGPGAYPTLGAYANRISSIRPVEGRYSDYRRNREARAMLYEGPNLSGRSMLLTDWIPNLARAGFNDRASSLRVESGYWIFCSDSDFRGECRTFGPGDYASLPGLNNVISSGRRISNYYPYSDRPDWQRDTLGQGAGSYSAYNRR